MLLFYVQLICERCSIKFFWVRFLYLNDIFFRKAKVYFFFLSCNVLDKGKGSAENEFKNVDSLRFEAKSLHWVWLLFGDNPCAALCLVAQSYLTLCHPMDSTLHAPLSVECILIAPQSQTFWLFHSSLSSNKKHLLSLLLCLTLYSSSHISSSSQF